MSDPNISSEIVSHTPLQDQHQVQSIQEHFIYKNRLQEFAQRSKIPLPVYQTIMEGNLQMALFRSTVVVDGKTFTSSKAFPNKKAAERDVAKIALEGICQMMKDCVSCKKSDVAFPPIKEDRVFCKSILNEFALKMNQERPTYNTVRKEGAIPIFVSSLNFNGVIYTGDPSATKKEAEQLAARAVILSNLGNAGAGAGAGAATDTLLLEIVKSKAELLFALHSCSSIDMDKVAFPMGSHSKSDNEVAASSEETAADANQTGRLIENATEEAYQRQHSSQATLPLITSLPSSQVGPNLHGLACVGKRKKKKKANKKVKPERLNDAVAECNLPKLQVV